MRTRRTDPERMKQANRLLRALNKYVFGDSVPVDRLAVGIGFVEDFWDLAIKHSKDTEKVESMALATEPCPDCGSGHHRSCDRSI